MRRGFSYAVWVVAAAIIVFILITAGLVLVTIQEASCASDAHSFGLHPVMVDQVCYFQLTEGYLIERSKYLEMVGKDE